MSRVLVTKAKDTRILPQSSILQDPYHSTHLLVQLLNPRANAGESRYESLPDGKWDEVVALALKQGVAPLLGQRLQQTPMRVPPRVLQELNDEYLATALRNMQLYKELNRIVKTFQSANIDTVVLKGAHIAQVAYGNVGLRPMHDLDVLVKRADLARAEQQVEQLGYVPHPDFPDREWAIQNHYHFCYSLPQEETILELHWEIEVPNSPFKVNAVDLIGRSLPISLVGIPTRVLTPEDLVLYLCIQISYHHVFDYAALRSLFDVAQVIGAHASEFNWKVFGARAAEWQATRCIYLALLLAREVAGASVPDTVLETLVPRDFDPRLARWAMDRILTVEEEVADPALASTISDGFGNVWTSRHWRGKMVAIIKTCFPSREKMAELYALSPESKQIYLQYPRRIQDLVLRHTQHVWGLVQGDETTRAWIEREGKRTALMRWITAND